MAQKQRKHDDDLCFIYENSSEIGWLDCIKSTCYQISHSSSKDGCLPLCYGLAELRLLASLFKNDDRRWDSSTRNVYNIRKRGAEMEIKICTCLDEKCMCKEKEEKQTTFFALLFNVRLLYAYIWILMLEQVLAGK